AIGAEDPEGRSPARLRVVLEELRKRVLGSRPRLLRRAELEDGSFERLDAFAGRARELERAQDRGGVEYESRPLRDEVHLVQDDDLGELVEPGPVLAQLVPNRAVLLLDLAGGDVDHVNEQSGPFEVSQELVTETGPFRCALDQSWDVGDDELAAV